MSSGKKIIKLSLEEYCDQKMEKIFEHIKPANNISKIVILIDASKIYLKKGLISRAVYDIINDVRFSRLMTARIKHLHSLLLNAGITSFQSGRKSKLAIMCYRNNLDIINEKKKLNYSDSLDDSDDGSQIFESQGKIYLRHKKDFIELSPDMILKAITLICKLNM